MSILLQKNLKSIRIEVIEFCEEILEPQTLLPETELEWLKFGDFSDIRNLESNHVMTVSSSLYASHYEIYIMHLMTFPETGNILGNQKLSPRSKSSDCVFEIISNNFFEALKFFRHAPNLAMLG